MTVPFAPALEALFRATTQLAGQVQGQTSKRSELEAEIEALSREKRDLEVVNQCLKNSLDAYRQRIEALSNALELMDRTNALLQQQNADLAEAAQLVCDRLASEEVRCLPPATRASSPGFSDAARA